VLELLVGGYQGMNLRNPFFFLLLDSSLESFLLDTRPPPATDLGSVSLWAVCGADVCSCEGPATDAGLVGAGSEDALLVAEFSVVTLDASGSAGMVDSVLGEVLLSPAAGASLTWLPVFVAWVLADELELSVSTDSEPPPALPPPV
jgi:hypothetical protein